MIIQPQLGQSYVMVYCQRYMVHISITIPRIIETINYIFIFLKDKNTQLFFKYIPINNVTISKSITRYILIL